MADGEGVILLLPVGIEVVPVPLDGDVELPEAVELLWVAF
jgi:hypothetical protein